jgi:hypothetical protein
MRMYIYLETIWLHMEIIYKLIVKINMKFLFYLCFQNLH